MISRLARWWLDRQELPKHPLLANVPRGWCSHPKCGSAVAPALYGDDLHTVVALGEDDDHLGVEGGGTGVAADFCAEHCPGGCRQGCVAR